VSLDGISGAASVRTVREIKHSRSTELACWLKAIFFECKKTRVEQPKVSKC
jgi:hypothetical protein